MLFVQQLRSVANPHSFPTLQVLRTAKVLEPRTGFLSDSFCSFSVGAERFHSLGCNTGSISQKPRSSASECCCRLDYSHNHTLQQVCIERNTIFPKSQRPKTVKVWFWQVWSSTRTHKVLFCRNQSYRPFLYLLAFFHCVMHGPPEQRIYELGNRSQKMKVQMLPVPSCDARKALEESKDPWNS